MRRYLPFPVFLFLILWIGLMVVGRASLFSDPGTFWHTVLGDGVLHHRSLNTHDTFSYTYAGQPWLSLQWLAEWAMAAANAIGGWDTLLLATVTLLAAFYAWIGARLARCGLHPVLATLAVLLTIAASSHHFHARPHLGSIILLGVSFALLCDVEAGRVRPLRLAALVPLFVVWTNVHGGVLAGLASIGLVVSIWTAWRIARAVAHRRGWHIDPASFPTPLSNKCELLTAWLTVAACAAALLINPYGAAMVEAWLAILRMPLTGLVVEHRALSITTPEGLTTAALGLAYVALLVDTLRTRGWRQAQATWILPAVWLLLAFSRIRHGPLFAAVGAIAMAELLPYSRLAVWLAQFDLFAHSAISSSARREEEPAPTRADCTIQPLASNAAGFPWRAGVIPIGLVALALLLQHQKVQVPVLGANWARQDGGRWPVALLPELKQLEAEAAARRHAAVATGLSGELSELRLFHPLDYGGFLIYNTPGLKTFIDDRCELYGPEFLTEYVAAEREQPEQIETWNRRYRFDAALVHAGSPFDRYLAQSPRWQLVRRAGSAALYRRTAGETAAAQVEQPGGFVAAQ